jgi:lactate oxidase
MISATRSNLSMEETAAFNPGPKWFQLDVPRDIGYLRELLQRAKEAGYTAIVPTVDNLFENPRSEDLIGNLQSLASFGRGNLPRAAATPAEAARKYDERKRDLSWDDMEDIKSNSGLPVIVKGILSPKAATLAFKHGMDAVYVSNYGGRTFDGVSATITTLPRIVDAVQDSLPIIFDGGIRRGSDVFKAIALGARAVACGRPLLYGLALGGSLGAQSVLEHLRDSLTNVMQLAGTRTLQDIKPEYLATGE